MSEARDAADETNRHKITENSLLTALVWQAYARALGPEAGELVLACPIDFRRLSPELSPSFFGNASAPALLRLERKLVLAESVTSLAAMISDAIRSCDELTLARYKVAIDNLRAHEWTRGDGECRAGRSAKRLDRHQRRPIPASTDRFWHRSIQARIHADQLRRHCSDRRR